MTDRLHYGFEGTRMYLDTPQVVFDRAMSEAEHLAQIVEYRANQRVVNVEQGDGDVRLLLNIKRAGNIDNDFVKESRVKHLIYAFAAMDMYSTPEQKDPELRVQMGVGRLGDNVRLGMSADVSWPHVPDAELQALTSLAMQETAAQLRYSERRSFTPQLVYAQIHREHGVTLEMNPAGACDLGTDGMFYESDEPVFEVNAHNIYTHSMQLIALSGLITIARA